MNINVFEPGDVSLRYHEARFDGVGKFSIQTPASSGGGGAPGDFTTLPGPSTCGSLYFSGPSRINVNQWGGFNFADMPFTVEWWQYETGENNPWVRPFNFGSYPSQTFGVSFEGGNFFVWAPNANYMGSIGSYKDQWVHFAVVRRNNIIRVYKNGTQLGGDWANSNYIEHVTGMTIGNEGTPTSGSQFGGYITNFHVMIDSKYASNFTPDTSKPIPPTTKTIYLLDADVSGNPLKDYTNINASSAFGVTWAPDNPFGF